VAYRELTRIGAKEVLRNWQAGQAEQRIARETGVDRNTVGPYVRLAGLSSVCRGTAISTTTTTSTPSPSAAFGQMSANSAGQPAGAGSSAFGQMSANSAGQPAGAGSSAFGQMSARSAGQPSGRRWQQRVRADVRQERRPAVWQALALRVRADVRQERTPAGRRPAVRRGESPLPTC
jgi:hypothetical protein